MTVKKSSIRQEIDSQFNVHQQQEDIDDFENPIAGAVQNLLSDDIQTVNSDGIDRFSSLRKRTFNDDVAVKGKTTSRSKLFGDYFNSLEKPKPNETEESIGSLSDNEYEEEGEEKEAASGDENESDGSDLENDDDDEGEEEEGDSGDDEDDYSILGSEDDDLDVSTQNKTEDNQEGVDDDFLYSKHSVTSEIDKGRAVQQQISLWDAFLECRIRLQKGIVAFNKFPSQEVLKKFNLLDELKKDISEAEENIAKLMETLISLHEKLCNQYEGFGNSDNLKRKRSNADKAGVVNKKRKLDEYSTLLTQMHTDFTPYQNEAIQKWNDKTKIASGKMANSNFSAFDQSVLQQIEHILNDKQRLVRRTQQRKSKYQRTVDGATKATKQNEAQGGRQVYQRKKAEIWSS
ncbi:hypothetical protein M8J76_015182 [Diaphorina citri]|nr:hypothetical protein M8J76_015182 [Diaphorina citri]